MATIVKTPAGTWKALIRKTGWPSVCKTFRTKRDACDWARSTEDEMVRGVYVIRAPAERLPLSSALDKYLKEVSILKKPSTQVAEKRKAKPLKKLLGRYALAAITPDRVAWYRDERLATLNHRTGQPLSRDTVRLELALLSHMFSVAMREWGLGLIANPVSSIKKPSAGQGRDRRLSAEEEPILLRAAEEYSNPMAAQIIRLALATGMRKGEVLSLRKRHVDLRRRIIHLPDTKNNQARDVPLTKEAVAVLREAVKNPIRPMSTDLIFFGDDPKNRDKPYSIDSAWRVIRRKAGLTDLRFHDLRHEAVSRLVEMGLSDQEVAAISGHKTMQMLRRYTHLRAEDLVAKLDRLAKCR
jgi:integrase